MNDRKPRRFGVREVKKGRYKGCLHVATERFQRFRAELGYLSDYLNRRVLPQDSEELSMSKILLALQNVLEHETEEVIRHYVRNHQSKHNLKFMEKIDEGFISFKRKFKWLHQKTLINDLQYNVMEQIRILRNAHIHVRPRILRQRYKYFGKSLLTISSLRKMFLDVEKVLIKLREHSGRIPEWRILPPGYASELRWSKEAIVVFDSY